MISKVRSWRKWVCSLGLVAVIISVTFQIATASPPYQAKFDGESIFGTYCSTCHTVGGGDSIGPDLQGVTGRQTQQWLVDFITDPKKVLDSGDPTATALVKKFNNFIMPNMKLSQEQILAVLVFLDTEPAEISTPTPTAPAAGEISPPTPTASAAAGDLENGKALFTEQVKLANGGPACVSCHSIDDVGILGGGTLGPNLTQASVKYGDAGLAAILANLSFPTMQPIFAGHPLTVGEQADLFALIKSSAGQPQPNKTGWVIAIGVGGFLAVMVVGGFIWRGRLKGVRRQLVEQSRLRK